MRSDFQDEVPKSRINITLDVDVGGAASKKELPLKMLVLGDFFAKKSGSDDFQSFESMPVDVSSTDSVLAKLNPSISVVVKDCVQKQGESFLLPLRFNSMKDFSPNNVLKQMPHVKRLVMFRELLKDLQANLVGNPQAKKAVFDSLSSSSGASDLHKELSKIIKSKAEGQPILSISQGGDHE